MQAKLLVSKIRAAVSGLPRDPEQVAQAVSRVVRSFASDIGMNPDIECDFVKPGDQKHIPAQNGWTVVFEAGPFDWAISASMTIIEETGVSCEPYHGFDLTFYRPS